MPGEKLLLAAAGLDEGVHHIAFQWNWSAMKGMDPDAETTSRISALHPLIEAMRAAYPRVYVLTNDETYVPNRPHRHMEDIAGNLEPQILQDYEYRLVPFEFCWGKLALGGNRWSYLLDLDDLSLDRFDRELLGMNPNPICYNFIFTRSTVSLDQLVETMSIPENTPGNAAMVWESRLLDRAGFLAFPKEESTLVLKSKDPLAIETLKGTRPWLGLSGLSGAKNRENSGQSER